MADPQIIDGRYEVLGTIGVGGMGVLYKARDPWIGGRTVAIKVLKDGIDDEEIHTRFKQEASAAGVLEHENIVRIFDVGEHERQPFIAMEFVDGDTLATLIKQQAPIPLLQKLEFVEQLCDALGYAHAHGIVHRDIKPLNLIIERRRQRLKVLDFGIAKVANSGITSAGMMIGTVNYMSPEQMRGDVTIDHRSDVFSVGATVFELLTGQRAFQGGITDGLMGRIMTQPSPSLLAAAPDLPVELEHIVARALAKRPDDRYPTLVQMRDEVRALRSQLRQGPDRTAALQGTVSGPASGTARGPAPPTLAGTSSGTASGSLPPPLPASVASTPSPVPSATSASRVTLGGGAAPAPLQTGVLASATLIATSAGQAAPPAGAVDSSSRRFGVFLVGLLAAAAALGVAVWLWVPWDVVLRPWRGPEPAPSESTSAVVPPPPANPSPAAAAEAPAVSATPSALPDCSAAQARLQTLPVTIDVHPWAEVRVVLALSGEDVAALPPEVVRELARERGPLLTPVSLALPAGTYVVSFRNEALSLTHTERITVVAGGEHHFSFSMPGFDADRAIAEIMRGPTR